MTAVAAALSPLVEAMLDPSFYAHAPEHVELVETHVSWVLLADDLAYKVRKPVVFPFLDYGTAERRRRMAEEELRLGRRLAPQVYLRVRAVVRRRGGGFELAPASSEGAVEHVLEMRRVPPERTLAALLERGAATEADVRRVARRLAEFHAQAPRAPAGTFDATAVAATAMENFTTLLPFAPELGEHALAAARRFAAAFVHGRRELLDARSRDGFVRDGHGDIRAQHVIVGADEIEVFDPVEFAPELRHVDVAADLGFLVMDLHAVAAEELADALVDEYARSGPDLGGDALLSFYAAYRAWVRAKVACLLAAEVTGEARTAALAEAREYALLAERLAWRARRPLVLVLCGRAAGGKSVLAGELGARARLPVLSSDVVRKELHGVAPHERAPESAYAEEESLRVYGELGVRAAAAGSAIVDATFRRRAHRDAFREAYGDAPPPLYVECVAPEVVLAERARRRERDPQRVSDAGAEIVARQAHELEPLDEVDPARHLVLRTDRAPGDAADLVAAWLDELALPPR